MPTMVPTAMVKDKASWAATERPRRSDMTASRVDWLNGNWPASRLAQVIEACQLRSFAVEDRPEVVG